MLYVFFFMKYVLAHGVMKKLTEITKLAKITERTKIFMFFFDSKDHEKTWNVFYVQERHRYTEHLGSNIPSPKHNSLYIYSMNISHLNFYFHFQERTILFCVSRTMQFYSIEIN